jgi:hypothetical protein
MVPSCTSDLALLLKRLQQVALPSQTMSVSLYVVYFPLLSCAGQGVYEAEGIDWAHVAFDDNQVAGIAWLAVGLTADSPDVCLCMFGWPGLIPVCTPIVVFLYHGACSCLRSHCLQGSQVACWIDQGCCTTSTFFVMPLPQECVDLIEARPPAGVGVLSLLDEECMVRFLCTSRSSAGVNWCVAAAAAAF